MQQYNTQNVIEKKLRDLTLPDPGFPVPLPIPLFISWRIYRVESGLDDPDNPGYLGHFFDGPGGSHPQTKLSGCDPDFYRSHSYSLQNNVGVW